MLSIPSSSPPPPPSTPLVRAAPPHNKRVPPVEEPRRNDKIYIGFILAWLCMQTVNSILLNVLAREGGSLQTIQLTNFIINSICLLGYPVIFLVVTDLQAQNLIRVAMLLKLFILNVLWLGAYDIDLAPAQRYVALLCLIFYSVVFFLVWAVTRHNLITDTEMFILWWFTLVINYACTTVLATTHEQLQIGSIQLYAAALSAVLNCVHKLAARGEWRPGAFLVVVSLYSVMTYHLSDTTAASTMQIIRYCYLGFVVVGLGGVLGQLTFSVSA
jgi:hypothetical protein